MKRLLCAAFVLLAPAVPCAPARAQVATSSTSSTELVVRAGDILRIRIWPEVTLGGEFPIEETGLAYLPILGAVPAAGHSITQLRAELRARYAESMKSPVVTITPLVRVSVMGAVTRPGVYFVPPTESLVDVILQAGGFNENADPDGVQLVREGRTIEVHAREAIQRGGAGAQSALSLRSDDWLIVPTRRSGISLGGIYAVLQIVTLGAVVWSHFAK